MTLKPIKIETNYDQTEAGMHKSKRRKKENFFLLLKRKGPSKYTIKKTFFKKV